MRCAEGRCSRSWWSGCHWCRASCLSVSRRICNTNCSFLLNFVVHLCTCSQTVFCGRQFHLLPNCCTLLHLENGSFEVSSLHQIHRHQNQVADILTKRNFARNEWNHLLCLFNVSHFSSTVCSEAMARRVQQDPGEERVTAISRPTMSLIARVPSNVSSSTSESPEKRSYESQSPWRAKTEREEPTGKPVVGSDQ